MRFAGVASEVDTEFPYRVRIVDRGVDCRDPVCRHRFRFPETGKKMGNIPVTTTTKIFQKVLRYKWEEYCDANGRRTAIVGEVLKYFPILKAQWHRKHCNTNWRCIATQIGGALQYKLEVYCNTNWRCIAVPF